MPIGRHLPTRYLADDVQHFFTKPPRLLWRHLIGIILHTFYYSWCEYTARALLAHSRARPLVACYHRDAKRVLRRFSSTAIGKVNFSAIVPPFFDYFISPLTFHFYYRQLPTIFSSKTSYHNNCCHTTNILDQWTEGKESKQEIRYSTKNTGKSIYLFPEY